MNLKQFLENPAGKGDSSMNRAVIISTLNEKYEKLIKDKNIKVRVYKTIGLNTEYYIHLNIPTETARDNSYDVVFHLYPNKDNKNQKIRDYDVRFFSNTPSFAYTFLYVYHKNGIFEESLANKFDKIFFTDKPEKRNQYGIVNYDKYLYFGAKFIYDSLMLSSKAALELRSVNYVATSFNKTIRSLDTIMNQYKRAENKLKGNTRRLRLHKEKERDVSSDGKVKAKTPKSPKQTEVMVKKPTKPKVKTIKKK